MSQLARFKHYLKSEHPEIFAPLRDSFHQIRDRCEIAAVDIARPLTSGMEYLGPPVGT